MDTIVDYFLRRLASSSRDGRQIQSEIYFEGERSENGVYFDFIVVVLSLPRVNFLVCLGIYDDWILILLCLRFGLSFDGYVLNLQIFGSYRVSEGFTD